MQFGQQTSSDPFSGRDSFRPAKFFMNAVCQIKNAHFRKIVTKRFDSFVLSLISAVNPCSGRSVWGLAAAELNRVKNKKNRTEFLNLERGAAIANFDFQTLSKRLKSSETQIFVCRSKIGSWFSVSEAFFIKKAFPLVLPMREEPSSL